MIERFRRSFFAEGRPPVNLLHSAALLAVIMATCGCDANSTDTRFRVAVTVVDAGKQDTFSKVWGTDLAESKSPATAPYSARFVAEAIPITISGRPTLYALTIGSHRNGPVWGSLATLPEILFEPDVSNNVSRNDRVAMLRVIGQMVGRSRSLTCDQPKEIYCPTFVYFDDERDPGTIHIVDPHKLPPVFNGARIASIAVTIVTDTPTDSGLSVPAFAHGAGWSKWYNSIGNNDPRKLTPEAFRSGM